MLELLLLLSPPGSGTFRYLLALLLNNTSHSQAHFAASGTMSEARRDSTSSLQRKKPPWLKLDIPAVAAPVAEEPSFLQVGPGQQGLWVHPVRPPYHDPIAQPLRRQAFLRSVSMPAETAHVPSPYYEPRRPVLQRQTSITQTIRRYHTALAASWVGALGAGGTEAGIHSPLWVLRLGTVQGPSPRSRLGFLLDFIPCVTLPSCSGD